SRTSIAFGLGILCVLGVWLVMEGKSVVSDYEFEQEIGRLESGKASADQTPTPDDNTKTAGNTEDAGGNGGTPKTNGEGDPDGDKPQPKPAEPQVASFDEYANQWAQFRGWQGMAVCKFKDIPTEWDEESKKNIAWKVPVPMKGLSSPIVWGDKVFLTGATRQKRETYCYDAKTGKLLWTGTYESNPAAPTDYSVYDSVSDVIHGAPTSVADGKHVYSFFANGEVACFDFNGKFVWSKYVASPLDNGYGNSASLLKYKDTVVVLLDGEDLGLYGLDGKTGKLLWSTQRNGNTWASPILIKSPKGSVQVVCSSNPVVEAFDPNTGERLWESSAVLGGDVAPTPTYNGGRVYAGMKDYSLAAFDPDQKGKMLWELWELEEASLPETTSPVSNGDLVYYYEGYMLVCVDAKTGEIVYEQDVGDEASYASPTIVGDKLYLFAGNLTKIVQVGREYKLLGTNKLESNVWLSASPAFAPGRMFLRGDGHLYCITKKAQ
ncbi:MAG: PQQ-binding-like beta-propeller repeat protein, partial [Phycisphaerae bacterium]